MLKPGTTLFRSVSKGARRNADGGNGAWHGGGADSTDWRRRGKNPRNPSKNHRRTIEVPSKYHRRSFVTSPSHHASHTQAARSQQAGRAGAGQWGLGELAELKRLPNQAGAEGLLSDQDRSEEHTSELQS